MNIQQPTIEATTGQQVTAKSEARRLSRRAAAWLAWSIWVACIAIVIPSHLLEYANDPSRFWLNLFDTLVLLLAYATVGALIASRHPENPVGWIFCAAILLSTVGTFAGDYATYALVTRPGSLPGGAIMGWAASWMPTLGIVLIFTFLLLLFPNGRLPSRRWRSVAWLAVGMILFLMLLTALTPGPLPSPLSFVTNPFGVESGTGFFRLLEIALIPLYLAVLGLCVASVVVRFNRAEREEREQLKWFAYAAVLAISVLILYTLIRILLVLIGTLVPPAFETTFELLLRLSLVAIAIAVGIAILKYRLYDIDLIINRTLVYVPLTGIVGGLYAASVALFQRLFQALTGERSDAAIVISTLILASLFTPMKNGLQAIVDKRLKEPPGSLKELRAFGEEIDEWISPVVPQQVMRRLLKEAVPALHAKSGAAYLRANGQMQLVHTYGQWQEDGACLTVYLEGTGRTQGERLGVIKLGDRYGEAHYSDKERETLQEVADRVAAAIASLSEAKPAAIGP